MHYIDKLYYHKSTKSGITLTSDSRIGNSDAPERALSFSNPVYRYTSAVREQPSYAVPHRQAHTTTHDQGDEHVLRNPMYNYRLPQTGQLGADHPADRNTAAVENSTYVPVSRQ